MQAFLGTRGNVTKIKFEVEKRVFKVYIPDDQYWISIKDILLNREYEYIPRFELKNFTGLVVDAGAHVGVFSLVSSVFARKVIALEPYPLNYSLLRINLARNDVDNVIAINKALSSQRGKLKIHRGNHSGKHSTFGSCKEFFEVPTITLEEIVSKYNDIDLLKMDVEGSEFEVFKMIRRENLEHIGAIVGEIHPDYGTIDTVVHRLKNSGFCVETFFPPLSKKKSSYLIKLHGLSRLKFLRELLYFLMTPIGFKTKDLVIVFALRKQENKR